MGQIFAHYTCTRVRWEDGSDDPIDEHGWVDRRWSTTALYDSRNDVSPIVNLPEDSEDLADEVREALDWLEGGYSDNGNGTFYSADSYQPFDELWDYRYALHFVRKSNGPDGWVERPWHPFTDGKISPKGE